MKCSVQKKKFRCANLCAQSVQQSDMPRLYLMRVPAQPPDQALRAAAAGLT